jgi:hypothetical protein
MRILWGEVKKIWNWKNLLIIAVVCALFYNIFMSDQIKYYKNGYPVTSDIEYAEEITRRYGNSLTDEELQDFIDSERELLIAKAEKYIQAMPAFAAAGIYSYADFEALLEKDEQTQEESDAYWTLLGEECGYLGFKLQTLRFFENERIGNLSKLVGDPDWHEYRDTFTEREQERLAEILRNGEEWAILTYQTINNTMDYAVVFTILILFCVLALVSPLLTTDRHNGIHYLQYSTKAGRKIVYSQLTAVLLSAFSLTTALIFVFGGIYSQNGTALFWNASVNSRLNVGWYSLFSMSYGQWVLWMAALMYVIALGAAALAFILSRYSHSLITLIMKLIPMFTALLLLCVTVFNGLFTMSNLLYETAHIVGTEGYICGIVGAAGLTAAVAAAKREKRADVV